MNSDKNKKTALIGAGAIGGYVISGLYDKYKDNFMLIAKDERAQRLESEGLVINGRKFSPRVVSPCAARELNLDYLIVAVKYNALEKSLEDIYEAVSENTVVVSLMNGVDSEEIIGRKIGSHHMLYSYIRLSSAKKGNEINFIPANENFGIFVGELDSSKGQSRAQAFKELFDGTDAFCHVKDDILVGMWSKFALNVSENLPQAVLGVGIGAYNDSRYVSHLRIKLREEIALLAKAKGIEIPPGHTVALFKASQRNSTLQDLDAGRETEIEMFSGAAVRMANQLNISCPYNEVMYDLIKALEEKNAGLFNY